LKEKIDPYKYTVMEFPSKIFSNIEGMLLEGRANFKMIQMKEQPEGCLGRVSG
jgi:hypothetical protein